MLEHDTALRLDLAPYRLTPGDLGGSLSWRASIDLVKALQSLPGTWLHMVANRWAWPATVNDLTQLAIARALGMNLPLPSDAAQPIDVDKQLETYQTQSCFH